MRSKKISINLPEWAQSDLAEIRKRFFSGVNERGFEATDEDIILEIISNYALMMIQTRAYLKIRATVNFADIEYYDTVERRKGNV